MGNIAYNRHVAFDATNKFECTPTVTYLNHHNYSYSASCRRYTFNKSGYNESYLYQSILT